MGWICVPVCRGADPRDLICALRDQAEGDLLQYPLLSDLRYGMYSCLLSRDRTACRDDHDREYHAPDPGSPDDELIPGFHQRGHDQRTSAFSEAMITAICVAAGFILSKILLGGML